MSPRYEELFALARPYLDTRENELHTVVACAMAARLLACHPDADAAVVMPAVILHDVGWKMVPEELQLSAFGPKMSNQDLRRLHEVEGARIAGDILARAAYDPLKREAVVRIVDGHDSRDAALSLDDALVKDADKLWRFTPAGVDVDHRRFASTREAHLLWLEGQIDTWLITETARAIARAQLAEARP